MEEPTISYTPAEISLPVAEEKLHSGNSCMQSKQEIVILKFSRIHNTTYEMTDTLPKQ